MKTKWNRGRLWDRLCLAFLMAGPVLASPGKAFAEEDADWSGCHLGVQVAALRAQSDNWMPIASGGAFIGQSLGGHTAGGSGGGVRIGCDDRMHRNTVIGIQADVLRGGAAGQHASARETGVSYHSNVKLLASVTGRAGYLPTPHLLGYVTAGIVLEHGHLWASTTALGTAYAASPARMGWLLGVGAEYRFARRWSTYLEYSHHRFGTRDTAVAPQVPGLPPAVIRITQGGRAVRAGLQFRF